MAIYALCVTAMNYETMESSSAPAIIRATDDEDAERVGMGTCLGEYPTSRGWVDHQFSFVRIPDAWIEHPEPE